MKKIFFKMLLSFILFCCTVSPSEAIQFDILVLPADLFSVCDNYFCFPEPSEIVATSIIKDMNSFKNLNTIDLSLVRARLEKKSDLKSNTEKMLQEYKKSDSIDFNVVKELSNEFDIKSVILISSFVTTDKSSIRRNLWEILEVSSAFKISYPFKLTTSVVLIDSVNNVVMWSGKYNKNLSNSDNNFISMNQAQAVSHLEKLRQYIQNNISKTVVQNVHLRFFPKDVKTFSVKKENDGDENKPKFVPNALEHLIKPQMLRELDDGNMNTSADDFIFEF